MLNRANERGQRNFALARRTLDAWSRRLGFLKDREVVPGIHPVWLPGHTPGHSGFRIDAAGQSLLIWGDIVHFPHIQAARPAAAIAFDCDPVQARATREAILARSRQRKPADCRYASWRVGVCPYRTDFARLSYR